MSKVKKDKKHHRKDLKKDDPGSAKRREAPQGAPQEGEGKTDTKAT